MTTRFRRMFDKRPILLSFLYIATGLVIILLILQYFTSPIVASQLDDDRYIEIWNLSTDDERYILPTKYKAAAVGLSEEDFIFFARVVEAESDRSYCDSDTTYGRILIATVVFNRVNSESWPSSVRSVLTQSGQFTTVSNGSCSIKSTLASEWAVVQAYYMLLDDCVPNNIIYFNCIGYNNGKPYDYVGGNYFMYG